MTKFDLTAKDQGYFRVFLDGEHVSNHVQEREAAEKATEVKDSNPNKEVYYDHDYRVDVTLENPSETTDNDTSTDGENETEPDPDPDTDVSPLVTFDPDLYVSTTDLLETKDPFGGSELGEDGNQGLIRLDDEVARPGGSKSMRYDYIDEGIGNSLHVGRRIPVNDLKEVWIEMHLRWSENFFAIEDFPQEGATFAHKLLFGECKARAEPNNWTTSDGYSVSRWSLLFPGGGSNSPPNGPIAIQTPRHGDGSSIVENQDRLASNYFDAEWHTVRCHWRHDPGRWYLEIDGEVIADRTGFTIHPEIDITAILLGRNKDDGLVSGTESLWWGKVRAWGTDPGW